MLANYNKILLKIVVHATTHGRCCSESNFQVFIYGINLFSYHDHPNNMDLFLYHRCGHLCWPQW